MFPRSTVVGNPGHPVRLEGRKVEGPDADWIHLPDPIADAIKALSERIAEVEQRLARSTAGPPLGRRREISRAPGAPRQAAEPAAPVAMLGG